MTTVTATRAARVESLEPRANSWLRWAITRPGCLVFEHEGGLLLIQGTTAKLSIPASEAAARALAQASSGHPIAWMIGEPEAVRAFVAARDDAGRFRLDGATVEMALLDLPQAAASRALELSTRAPGGRATTAAALSAYEERTQLATRTEATLPAPFDRWMDDFARDRFPEAGAPPPVRPEELWVWCDGDRPVAMAGALSSRPSDLRIVTVWTPVAERGKGYASALVHAIGRDAFARGVPNITLNVQADNTPAVRAYQRAGFTAVARTENWIRAR